MMIDTPFSISPNPLTLYLTASLEAVLFKSRFTIDKRQGLTCILGDVGLGKSTVVRYLHAEYDSREDVISLFVPTPSYTSEFAMMQALCADVGLPARRSILAQQADFQEWLVMQYQNDLNIVLFIDEAQRLTSKMLEVVRALLNYETSEHKLIQIVLAGQLELRDRLKSDKQKALFSRLIAPSVLSPLTLEDMRAMLEYRTKRAKVNFPFSANALEQLYLVTSGVPRSVLRLAGFAYEMMQQFGIEQIDAELIKQSAQEMTLEDVE